MTADHLRFINNKLKIYKKGNLHSDKKLTHARSVFVAQMLISQIS